MTAGTKKRILILCVILFILILLVWGITQGNTALECNAYTIASDALPNAFDGFRIAHISDLHNTQMGENNHILIKMLQDAKPDIIAITGDLVDSRNTDIEIALQFAEKAAEIAPCYYVTGNHEARIPEYDEMKKQLTEIGVVVLEDEQIVLSRSGAFLALLGVDDPSFQTDYLFGDAEAVMDNKLQDLAEETPAYTVLLSHRPELFDVYAKHGMNLVLSGHAHGGQFRFPFVGGLFAPNQGLFPEYDAGQYAQDDTTMIVSRGIGNSIIPFRINNPPEVILIELKHVP